MPARVRETLLLSRFERLGTRFSVYEVDGDSRVALFEGGLELRSL